MLWKIVILDSVVLLLHDIGPIGSVPHLVLPKIPTGV